MPHVPAFLALVRGYRIPAVHLGRFWKQELGCAATASVTLPGRGTYFVTAGSGESPLHAAGQQIPENWPIKYPAISAANFHGKAFLRDRDAEFKILNYIAHRLGNAQLAAGAKVRLYVQLPPCPSCTQVITGFKMDFPNMLEVTNSRHAHHIDRMCKKIESGNNFANALRAETWGGLDG